MTNRTGSPIFLAFCTLPILPVAWVVWRAYPGDPITAGHQLVVGDYLNLWIGGHLASDGRIDVIFDPIRFAEYVWSLFSRALERDRLRLTSTSGVNQPLKQRLRP